MLENAKPSTKEGKHQLFVKLFSKTLIKVKVLITYAIFCFI